MKTTGHFTYFGVNIFLGKNPGIQLVLRQWRLLWPIRETPLLVYAGRMRVGLGMVRKI